MASPVALLAEGVGRNTPNSPHRTKRKAVALLAEGVGRNVQDALVRCKVLQVALLAEGVGRNANAGNIEKLVGSRPPRGGRG